MTVDVYLLWVGDAPTSEVVNVITKLAVGAAVSQDDAQVSSHALSALVD